MQKNYAEVKQINRNFNGYEEKDKGLSQLQSKISLSNFQMLQLTLNDQKFSERIQQLNQKAFHLIQSTKFQQALIFLVEAQKLLQYAAGRGCSLDRQVIIKILNNQAVAYQKIWDIQRSISYLEAIIFHLSTFLELKQNKDIANQIQRISQQAENSSLSKEELKQFLSNNYEKIKSFIQKKFSLSLYFLQFSILNSQHSEQQIVLEYSIKAVKSYQETLNICVNFIKLKNQLFLENHQNIEQLSIINVIKEIKYFKTISQESFDKIYQNISRRFEEKSNISNSFHFILQKYASLEKKEVEYKNFSINSVMELRPQSFKREILTLQKPANNLCYIEEIDDQNQMNKRILQYAVTLFTVSSQIRENFNESIFNSICFENEIFQDYEKNLIHAQKYHLLNLKISVEIVEQLSQFARYCFKNYTEIYQNDAKANFGSLTKMDCLKQKYKGFISKGDSIIKDLTSSGQIFDHTISDYSVNLRPSIKGKQKENTLQKLFKQNSLSTPEKPIQVPPRLNIDLSQIESVEYGASKTFKQKNNSSNNKQPQLNQELKDKQTKNLNILQVKKILTVPNISDISSNKQSQISSREKSKSSKKDIKEKSKLKNQNKFKKPKNKIKSVSSVSKNKIELRKFLSPKNYVQKSYKSPQKKKSFQVEYKMFSQRKIFMQNQKNLDKKIQKKLIKADQKVKKIQKTHITPQLSNRNISQKSEIQKELFRPQSSRKIFKLRKAKSFQEAITPFQEIKPIVYQSKDLSDRYNFNLGNKGSKVKLIADSKKTKSTQNIKFITDKKDKFKNKDQKVKNQIHLSCKNGQKKLQQLKDIGAKIKKSSQIKNKQPHPTMAWKQNAVRMSSLTNLMQPINKKQGLKKIKSSQSNHTLNSSSDYFIKGFNINSSQRTKAGSLAITESLRFK